MTPSPFDKKQTGARKVAELQDDAWVDRQGPSVYALRGPEDGQPRFYIGGPKDPLGLVRALLTGMSGPFWLLYVLHTARGSTGEGRYQSPEIDSEELGQFLDGFAAYLSADARFDLWVRAVETGDMIIWDRHDDIFIYGELTRFENALSELGFQPGEPPKLGEHMHYYRAEFDDDADALLAMFNWHRTPLREEDIQ